MRRVLVTLWPLWVASFALTVAHVLLGQDRPQPIDVTLIDNAFFALSVAVLPFLAGYLYLRRCNGALIGAALAGVSIPFANVLGVGVAYLILQAGWLAFAGFVLATFMLSVLPSALFGVAGRWVARKYVSRHT
jgi:hypothetical protein